MQLLVIQHGEFGNDLGIFTSEGYMKWREETSYSREAKNIKDSTEE